MKISGPKRGEGEKGRKKLVMALRVVSKVVLVELLCTKTTRPLAIYIYIQGSASLPPHHPFKKRKAIVKDC